MRQLEMVINKSQTAEVVPRKISIHSFCLFFSEENHGDGSGVDDTGEFLKSFLDFASSCNVCYGVK